jgi:hypothetical protein
MNRSLLALTLGALCTWQTGNAAELTCVGVLGNSGEQGSTLVRYSDSRNRTSYRDGLGMAVDRFGTFWDRAGSGRLNRYAADGRCLGFVAIPNSTSNGELICVGDHLVMHIGDNLLTVDTTLAIADMEAKPLKVDGPVSLLGSGSADGKIVALTKTPSLLSIDVRSGTSETLPMPEDAFSCLGISEHQEPFIITKKKHFLDFHDGSWRERGVAAEERLMYADGAYWNFAWHGTVKRFDTELAPAPGVVLGGASGSFIGHLEGNYDLDMATGLARFDTDVYALGGISGIAHLATWDAEQQALHLVRRIGAVDGIVGSLVIGPDGNVRVPTGYWRWDDAPDAPIRGSKGLTGNGQATCTDSGIFFSASYVYGTSPAMSWGQMDEEASTLSERWAKDIICLKNVAGCGLQRIDKRLVALRLTTKGSFAETRLGNDGKPQSDLGKGEVQTAKPVKAFTSLVWQSADRFLAAGDGHLITFARDGASWKESARTHTVGDITFGSTIYIAPLGARILVSDRDHHQVLVLNEQATSVEARFGNEAGDDLSHCNQPSAISGSGTRIVVHDAGNFRILKMELQ